MKRARKDRRKVLLVVYMAFDIEWIWNTCFGERKGQIEYSASTTTTMWVPIQYLKTS